MNISDVDFAKGVAPYAGAWIEIEKKAIYGGGLLLSLPTRERGLK